MLVFEGDFPSDTIRALSAVGDIDGDGRSDFVVGASFAYRTGAAYLISSQDLQAADSADGSLDQIVDLDLISDQPNSFRFVGTLEDFSDVGEEVLGLPDIDGDGLPDLLIGAPFLGSSNSVSGLTYFVSSADFSAADALDGSTDGIIELAQTNMFPASYTFVSADGGDDAPSALTYVDDFDGDGRPELVIAASNATSPVGIASGEVYVVASGDLSVADAADGAVDRRIELGLVAQQPNSFAIVGSAELALFGSSVSGLGDIDGDGRTDLLVGEPGGFGENLVSGRNYVLLSSQFTAADAIDGVTNGVISAQNISALPGSFAFLGIDNFDRSGGSVASGGDIDADGRDDLLINAPTADAGGSESGEVYLIASADLDALDGADGVSGGDINLANVAATGASSFLISGSEPGESIGFAVTFAGDVNGDGRDDILLGNPGSITNTSSSAYLISAADLTSADAADGALDGIINVENVPAQSGSYMFVDEPNSSAGIAVSSAGDVDGDGLSDFLVAAPFVRPGQAYLIFASELAALDISDGFADGVIALSSATNGAPGSNITGTASADTIAGSALPDVLNGLGGDDLLNGFGSDDVLIGQDGADTLIGGAGNDNLSGGNQADVLSGGEGNDTVSGGNGQDIVFLNQGNDVFNDDAQGGVFGADTVNGGLGDDTINGGAGADEFAGGDGFDLIFGGLGFDLIFGGNQSDTIRSGEGSDTVFGGNGRDDIILGNGDDTFNDNAQGGDAGRDTVDAGAGNDSVNGGAGADQFFGGDGFDLIFGGLGFDLIFGGNQSDTLSGGLGNDTIFGGNGRDEVFMNQGADVFNDNTQGGAAGADTVFAGNGFDTINGGAGADMFFGGNGDDSIFGGRGFDTLSGGAGSDTLTGGAGADTFVFLAEDVGSGVDLVTDFELGTDVFRLIGASNAAISYDTSANEVTVLLGGNTIGVLQSAGDLSGFGIDDIAFV